MRWVLTLIVVLGLGLTTFWLLDGSGTTPPPPSYDPEYGDTGQSGDPTLESGSITPAAGGEAASQIPDAIVREESTPDAPSRPGPHIQVVRGEDQQPVANAIVYFLPENDPRVRSTRGRMGTYSNFSPGNGSRWEGPELHGKRLRTDQDGKVQLPGGTARYLCSAKKGDEFGFLALPARLGNHTITLQPDEELLIVVKHAGHPARGAASIPVGVLQEYKTNRTTRIWRGTTDDRGHAIVRHLQLLRRSVSSSAKKDFAERFAALAMVPSAPATLIEFDGRPLKEASVELTLPPQGSLLAKLVDHNGKPLLSSATINFPAASIPRKPGDMRVSSGYLNTSVSKPVGSAAVEVPHAQVGMQVLLSARYPHDRRSAKSKPTTGPSKVGERVAIEIPPLARHTVFAGRFLQSNGKGLNAQKVAIMIWRDDKVQSSVGAETIADGRWDLVVSGRTEKARWRMEFRCEQAATDDDVATSWLGAMVDLPPWPPGQRIELGDIVLGELPPLAAGIVVDDRGDPVANATVNIQQEQPQSKAATRSRNNIRQLGNIELQLLRNGSGDLISNGWLSNQRQPRWRSLRQLRTRTGADGTFAIYAPMPTGTLRVHADTGDHASQSLPLTGPRTNLRLEIARNGVLMGSVLVPEWLPDRAVTVTVRGHDKNDKTLSSASTRVDKKSGGKFVLQPLRPGRYDVLVKMRNLKTEMASVLDVVIQPGLNKQPRMQPLDVRQALHRYYLTAFDDSGQPFPLDGPIQARFQQPDGTYVESGFRWQKGKAELISMHANAELTFFGRGFQPLKQQFSAGEHQVTLKKQRPARVQLPGARGLAGPTRKVRISAILVGDTGLPSSLNGTDQITGRNFSFARWDLGRTSGGWLEQTDIVEIPLMTAGKYQLLWRAHATESTKTPQTQVDLGTFELRPDGTAITNVPLNVTEISEALRKIDKRWQDQLARNKKRSNR